MAAAILSSLAVVAIARCSWCSTLDEPRTLGRSRIPLGLKPGQGGPGVSVPAEAAPSWILTPLAAGCLT